MKKLLITSILFCAAAIASAQDFTKTSTNLWPDGKMPGVACTAPEKSNKNTHITNVSTPTLEVYLPKDAKTPRGVVIVCPGGGYAILAYEHEGTDIAKCLVDEGIAAVVLKYRVPNNRAGALMDVQRAIRTVRENAKKWNINPSKIAVLGFSAGANLCARASTLYGQKTYDGIDAIDNQSARPDYTCLIYPAYCDEPTFQQCWGSHEKKSSKDYSHDYELASELKIDAKTPPAFIIQTQDDNMWVNSSIAYYLALKKAKVPACLHMFDAGGHGYGLRAKGKLVAQWESLCKNWLKFNKFAD